MLNDSGVQKLVLYISLNCSKNSFPALSIQANYNLQSSIITDIFRENVCNNSKTLKEWKEKEKERKKEKKEKKEKKNHTRKAGNWITVITDRAKYVNSIIS